MRGTEMEMMNTMNPGHDANDEIRWKAVLERDPDSDGTFIYAVVTTGVYCRPICSSRRPLRKNVRFFGSWEDAERAGFRACMRCAPASGRRAPAVPDAVARACEHIRDAEDIPSLKELAEAAGLSPWHFHRLFKSALGVTPKEYASEHRAQRLRRGLQRGDSVTGAMYDAGFGSSSRLYEGAGDLLGMPPKSYRKGGHGEFLRSAVAESSLGWVLVAATERGICAIELADDPEELRKRLHERFAHAQFADDDPQFSQWVADAVRLIEDPARGTDLPLDVRGTAFQHRVWKALREIPAGSTASYADVARMIGNPKGVRAVARACASNTVAVAIPCHRVTRSDGEAGGYRWGAGRKKELLKREKDAEEKSRKR